jgi:aryl-alcohol dehydrogenase-like predicted oxidoreductase
MVPLAGFCTGACLRGARRMRRAHTELPASAVQYEFSMLWGGPEDGVIALCQELGIGFVPWSWRGFPDRHQ